MAQRGRAGARAIAGAVAVGCALVVAWFGSFGVLLMGSTLAQRPDPTVPDGDPCCSYPDTWGDVAADGALALAGIVLAWAALLACLALFIWGLRGRRPRLGQRTIAAVALLVPVLCAVELVVLANLD